MRTLRRIILTAAVGSVTFVLTNLIDQPLPWAITLSVLIGGVTLLSQFLVDFEVRQYAVENRMSALERSNAAVASTVREEVSRFNETAGMLNRLAGSAAHAEAVLKLVRLSADMPERVPALARDIVLAQVDSAVSFLEQLSHGGEASYEGEDRDWLLTMTAHARRSIYATSRVTESPGNYESIDGGLWNSDLGSRYLDAQIAAIGRGVIIRRIFILENSGVAGQATFRTVRAQQTRAGIAVRVLDASTLNATLVALIPDLVLFDEELSYEMTTNFRLDSIAAAYAIKTTLTAKPSSVRAKVQRFNDYWEMATQANR